MTLPTSTRARVAEFHEKFDCPVVEGPASLEFERARMRMSLIEEEFCELLEAFYGAEVALEVKDAITAATAGVHGKRDVVGVADALGDLKYVIDGFGLEAGIPLDDVVAEIHRSNMSKLGEDGKPVILTSPPEKAGKVGKGPHYTPPQLGALIAEHNARFSA